MRKSSTSAEITQKLIEMKIKAKKGISDQFSSQLRERHICYINGLQCDLIKNDTTLDTLIREYLFETQKMLQFPLN